MDFGNNTKISVEVSKGGIRYGTIEVAGVKDELPSQAITTTNLNHLDVVGATSFDFGTKILEIFPTRGKISSLLDRRQGLDKETERLRKIISKNFGKICFLLVPSAKTLKIGKDENLVLIELQVKAGFRFVKVFIKNNRKAVESLEYYRNLLPEGKILLPVLDEKLKNEVFRGAYLWALGKVPIVGFLGRERSKGDTNVKENYLFIRVRKNDQILRLVSGITKKTKKGFVKSALYKWVGYDIFAFTTKKRSNYKIKSPLEVVRRYRYVPLNLNGDIACPLNSGKRLIETAERFGDRSTVPCSMYSIRQINKELKELHKNVTDEQLADMLKEDIRLLVS